MAEVKLEAIAKLLETRNNRLLSARTLILSEGVSSKTAERLVSDLLILDHQSDEPIYLYINSPGGEVNSGFSIYDTIRFISAPVTIVNVGLCASIATVINVSVPKERRFGLPNSQYLIHQPSIHGTIQGSASDIEIHAESILESKERANRVLAEACGQNFDKVARDTERDYWMGASEAVEYGLIGKVISTKEEAGRKR